MVTSLRVGKGREGREEGEEEEGGMGPGIGKTVLEKKKGEICVGDLSEVVLEEQLRLMRFFFCLCQFLDLHDLRDFNFNFNFGIDQGKCNGLYAICTNFSSKIRWRRLKFE